MHRCAIALVFLLAAVAAEEQSLRVVCTTTVVADLVRQVGGCHVACVSLIAPGVDSHVYQPTPDDVKSVAHADLVAVNGLGMEGWVDQLVAQSGFRGVVVVATKGIAPLSSGEGGGLDPHAWQDARNGVTMAENLRDALAAKDPVHADDYRAWCELYVAELSAVDAWIRKQMATLPGERRVLVTSHDALQYFGKAYGLEIHAVEGITTGQEPDAKHVAALIDLLRRKHVPAVFIENVDSPKVIEQISGEGGAVLGGELFTDTLDQPGRLAGSYLGMFAANVRTIVSGLSRPVAKP